MPAQWKAFRRTTIEEMLAGRANLPREEAIKTHVGQGVLWLIMQFQPSGLEFSYNIHGDQVDLIVSRNTVPPVRQRRRRHYTQELFRISEPAFEFVSPAMLTKIILVA